MKTAEIERFWAKVERGEGNACWVWVGYLHDGWHGQVRVGGKARYAHRVSWEMANGPIPEGMVVRHRCDNPACVNPRHLELGTHADNVADRVARGRSAKGEANGRAKLSGEKVEAIRARIESGDAQTQIATDFGVSRRAVYKIKTGKTWSD
jgi:hypothetical protein